MHTTESVIGKLLEYCQRNDWSGYDPYDALNSELFKTLPFLNFKLFRLGMTQMLKRFPINFRRILLIPSTQNPKGLAIILTALLRLSKVGFRCEETIETIAEKLIAMRSPHSRYWCWGYSFPWQTRTILVPRSAPNLVCTTFVGNALLDIFQDNSDPRYLEVAVNAAEYILNELIWTESDGTASLSYPLPSSRSLVHNANFLGAAFLSRVYQLSGEDKFLGPALKIARYSAARQHEDGSWYYGELPHQRWVDNFHTGYNLNALRSVQEYTGITEFEFHLRVGFEFYRKSFFRHDAAPKYFHNRTYPIDIHSVAQSIITLQTLKDLDENNTLLAHAVFKWAVGNMWDKRGYFYYQSFPFFTNKIPYMRWSQAWMLLALSMLLEESAPKLDPERE